MLAYLVTHRPTYPPGECSCHEVAQEEEAEEMELHEFLREGDTLLHIARRYGSKDAVAALLDLGASESIANRVGVTAARVKCERK